MATTIYKEVVIDAAKEQWKVYLQILFFEDTKEYQVHFFGGIHNIDFKSQRFKDFDYVHTIDDIALLRQSEELHENIHNLQVDITRAIRKHKEELINHNEQIKKQELCEKDYDNSENLKYTKEQGIYESLKRNNLIEKYVDEEEEEEKDTSEIKQILGNTYEMILSILRDYSDLKERDYKIIALWIIGTYYYKTFPCYPYLFLNAMKGSGKSRTLRLITTLSWNGRQLGSMTEAGLFRIAGNSTIGIDEFEGIAKKENHGLREILNSGYKKGMSIIRMRKKKTPEGEQQVAEEFEPYTPIVLANIWGMEEVLGDRCITCILEKSSSISHIKKMEDFSNDLKINVVKSNLNLIKSKIAELNYTKNTDGLVQLCSYFRNRKVYIEWNNYINNKYTYTTLTTQTTLFIDDKINDHKNGLITQTTQDKELLDFFNKIDATGLSGRDLELYLPLFIIANILDFKIFEEITEIAKEITKEKKNEEMTDSKDVSFLEFISLQDAQEYYKIKEITGLFRNYVDYDPNDEYSNWLNNKWIGRALKRLELVIDKRRLAGGIEVTLNILKAREKLKIFK